MTLAYSHRQERSRRAAGGLLLHVLLLGFGLLFGFVAATSVETLVILPGALIGLAVLLLFWAMPTPRSVPMLSAWRFFVGFFISLTLWPTYISLQLPGLPWITVTRLLLFCALILWLYCIFNSPVMQARVRAAYEANTILLLALVGYMGALFLSIGFSPDISQSVSKFSNYQIYWTFPFFAFLSLVDDWRKLRLLAIVLVAVTGVEVLIAVWEWRSERIVWLDWLPPGFSADSEYLQRVVAAKYRAGNYRTQGTFSVNLSYAEFLALSFPFSLFLALHLKSWPLKTLGTVVAVMTAFGVAIADSRSGLIGVMLGFVGTVGLWAFRRWRAEKTSLLGPAATLLFPGFVALFAGVVLTSRTLSMMVFGDGAQAASNAARWTQFDMGMPKFFLRPIFGWGVGMGGAVVGFVSPSGVLTIDTWVLSSLVESGAVGFLCFCAMLFYCVITGILLYVFGRAPSSVLGGALAIALLAFATIKLVLSQVDNHALVFMYFAFLAVLQVLEKRHLIENPAIPKVAGSAA